MIEVYGQSDDILVLDGAPYPADEIGCYNSTVMVSFSDGTVIEAGYPKNDKAVWWIQVRKKGTAKQTLIECDDEDAEIYSDIFQIDAELRSWEVMQNNKEDNNIPAMFYPQVEGITPTVVEPNTDCISRQAVLEMAYDMSAIDGEHFTETYMVVDAEDIQKLPSVNPAEKIGHWTKDVNESRDLFDTVRYYCSACGDWNGYGPCKYCPNCGAKMMKG